LECHIELGFIAPYISRRTFQNILGSYLVSQGLLLYNCQNTQPLIHS